MNTLSCITQDAKPITLKKLPPNALGVVVEDNVKTARVISVSKVKTYKLQTWPDISQMHDDLMLDASRVSALLAMRPATLDVISSLLELSISRTEATSLTPPN